MRLVRGRDCPVSLTGARAKRQMEWPTAWVHTAACLRARQGQRDPQTHRHIEGELHDLQEYAHRQ